MRDDRTTVPKREFLIGLAEGLVWVAILMALAVILMAIS